MQAGLSFGLALLMAAATAAAAGESPSTTMQAPSAAQEPALMSPKALQAATLAVTRAGPRLVAVGERGTVLLSDDNGQHWRQAAVPVRTTLTAVRFVDERLGWAVGHQGVILHSQDGGEHWVRQLDGTQAARLIAAAAPAGDEAAQRAAQRFVEDGPDKPFFDVSFADAQHGYAVGAYNLAFSTANGGQTWEPMAHRLPNPKARHLYAVQARQSAVYIAGEQGLLLKSEDAGAHFNELATPYKGSYFGLLLSRSGSLMAHGLRGNVFVSHDAGRQWEKLETHTPASLTASLELPDGRWALLGQTGELLLSSDQGRTLVRQDSGEPLPASGLSLTADQQWVLATLRGTRRVTPR
jgi:photosystem II stability/assembly factor-like uncharacterized protein